MDLIFFVFLFIVHISRVKPKSANNSQADQQVAPTAIDGQPEQQFWIDPEVRERIANPKDPVRMPDKPFLHRSYQNGVRYDENINPNKSFVGGMFGREWRLEREREDLKRDLEEDAEEERRRKTLIHPKDNICPTFMIWGVCHRGDNCHLRHPPGRYLKRPPRNATSPEHAPEEPKKEPNSLLLFWRRGVTPNLRNLSTMICRKTKGLSWKRIANHIATLLCRKIAPVAKL